MIKYDDYLNVGIEAARASGELIRNSFNHGHQRFESKADNSPVTEVDKHAEAIIKQVILNHFPTHAFLGEETGMEGNSDFVWIIDPIDGTKNFVRGIPLFATLIALMHKNRLVVGISNAAAMNETVYAARGMGAFCNDAPIHVSSVSEIENAYVGHAGIKHFDQRGKLPHLQHIINSAWGSRGIGDAWAYHLVAQGKIDVNIEAKVKFWDIAAPTVIIEEAGGVVSDLSGNLINLDSTSIIAANNFLHQKVLSFFK